VVSSDFNANEKARLMAAIDAEQLKSRVTQVLASEVGPALAMDGTAIEVLDVTDGIVQVRLGGVCSGCPSTLMAVIMGIEMELRKHVPEVEYLEAVP
jgi:Fe-S cluster biogenesis protein NfuA